jgi:AcrR family transcriptional regulator
MTADSAPPAANGLCTHAGTPLRSDGVEARNRLLRAALPLFAAKGFAKTSTREVAAAAGVNLAAISYYFGDKAGLYRAVYNDPLDCGAQGYDRFVDPQLDLRAALHLYLQGFTDPLKEGELARQLMQLHFREMLEPTGLWQEHIETQIAPMHQGLLDVLGRALGLLDADDDLHRLAFSITALGIQMFVGADITRALRPGLADSVAAIDTTHRRLTDFAMAMVEDERQRRQAARTP